MRVSETSPTMAMSVERAEGTETRSIFRLMMRYIGNIQSRLGQAINANAVVLDLTSVTVPTPDEDRWTLWVDPAPIPGNPKAYLRTTQDGVTYTFLSDETA